jgi:hypothetical protein
MIMMMMVVVMVLVMVVVYNNVVNMIEYQNEHGITALVHATSHHHVHVVTMLLDRYGANLS